jgi:hypothetical protein
MPVLPAAITRHCPGTARHTKRDTDGAVVSDQELVIVVREMLRALVHANDQEYVCIHEARQRMNAGAPYEEWRALERMANTHRNDAKTILRAAELMGLDSAVLQEKARNLAPKVRQAQEAIHAKP